MIECLRVFANDWSSVLSTHINGSQLSGNPVPGESYTSGPSMNHIHVNILIPPQNYK